MVRKNGLVPCIFMLLALILVSCSQNNGNHHVELEKSIASIIAEEDVMQIDFNQVTDFSWDQAYIFKPYTSQKVINDTIGLDFKQQSQIHIRDDINLIIFLKNNKVVQYAEISRRYADFIVDSEDGFTPQNATINLEK